LEIKAGLKERYYIQGPFLKEIRGIAYSMNGIYAFFNAHPAKAQTPIMALILDITLHIACLFT
jgi:hypothetical protein